VQCAGGAALKVEPRFWRSNDTSPHVYQCQLARACEGDPEGRYGPAASIARPRVCAALLAVWAHNSAHSFFHMRGDALTMLTTVAA
jgi:hypothetical protein